ncbi:MAG: hypothetical protein HZA19_07135, partial [Nitrospirae bacterium]|nr:hypothetical protein [Nitrospirota bacterium]
VVVSGYPKGERLGILTLHLRANGRMKWYDYRWQPLGPDIRENEKVRELLKEYDKQVAELYAAEETKLQGSEGPYVGVEQCRQCHGTFVESWKKTKHAGAWEVLERVGKTHDPECIQCHVVGFGESGGFRSVQSTPSLVNVQCEVCHGPGRPHLTDGYGPMREIGESTCLRCHVPGHSPDFEYSTYRKKILHHP